MRFSHLAANIFDTPILIRETKAKQILSALGPRMGFELREPVRIYDDGEDGVSVSAPYCGYEIENGVARIPIIGTLVHRCIGMEAMSGMTSYLDISAAFQAAVADDNVKAILLEVDSPGGEAAGAFDLADEIYNARGIKPIAAVAKDWACSGAYLIASAADKVVTTQTGDIGSVGVVWCHVDYSAQNKMLGEAVTYIFAGKHKVDGNPDAPLSPDAAKRFQAHVDATYSLFVSKVARHRSMTDAAVRATEADIYYGTDGVAIGFADEVGTLADTLETLAGEAQPPALLWAESAVAAQTQEMTMTTKVTAPAGAEPQPGNPNPQPNPPTPAPAPQPSPHPEPNPPRAAADGRTEERARIAAIMDSEEAKGRETQARHLAFSTDLSAEQARAILNTAPKTEVAAPKPPNRLEDAMSRIENPKVGADTAADGEDAEAATLAASIVAIHRGNGRGQQRSN